MPEIDINHLAKLAALELSDSEAKAARNDLSRIIEMIDLMQQVDTDDIEPLASPLDGELRLRPDAITEPERRDDYQATAPSVADGLYLVPKVIE